MANITDLKTSLINKLRSIDGIQYVYDYRKSNIDGFPAVFVMFKNFESEYADSARDLRRYTFSVQVIQERDQSNFGAEKGERVLYETIDAILSSIDADSNFSNSEVVYSDPFSGDIEENGEYLIATIDITMKALVNVTI